MARRDKPDFLLLTDADIAHEPDSLRDLVAAAGPGGPDGFDLVSQMARLRVESVWERLVVPAFVYFFGQLYPFRRVNSARSRTAAAAEDAYSCVRRPPSGPGSRSRSGRR